MGYTAGNVPQSAELHRDCTIPDDNVPVHNPDRVGLGNNCDIVVAVFLSVSGIGLQMDNAERTEAFIEQESSADGNAEQDEKSGGNT